MPKSKICEIDVYWTNRWKNSKMETLRIFYDLCFFYPWEYTARPILYLRRNWPPVTPNRHIPWENSTRTVQICFWGLLFFQGPKVFFLQSRDREQSHCVGICSYFALGNPRNIFFFELPTTFIRDLQEISFPNLPLQLTEWNYFFFFETEQKETIW